MSWATIIMWVVGAIGGGITLKWGFYQLGKKTQKSIQMEKEIEQGDKEKKVLGMLAQPDASNDDELIGRLRGKRRR
jgi:hypothetical protein